MNKLQICKNVIGFVVGISVSYTIKEAISNNVEPETKRQEVAAWIGTAALSMVVKDVVQESVNTKIDLIVEQYNKSKNKEIPATE